ncbi:hypothetical protein A374_07809 [Fictibacillus macauensis ZFHKF-1]|uniref:General stress protein 17M-like domain-containing protein n=1 Tax=Fictibacillus macauensis ZFHKF-1 TaxID=1196324 RepID=I8UFW9_9BACL|nr:general stress protein [Fictibacillus macauensis]EIT85723.1 hypothetical protein A374_07809 [Fictibacillus macauensis ZFHKF-1]
MSKDVIGVYDSEQEAIQQIRLLVTKGFHPKDISILAKDEAKMDHIADDTKVLEEHVNEEMETAAYGTIAGFLSGIGGAIAVPGLGVPGIGPLLAAGPFVSMFPESTEEDLRELFMSIGIDQHEAERYVKEIEQGNILVFLEKKAKQTHSDTY